MDIDARQLALRNFQAAQHAETESARLLNTARADTMRAPGSRAAVLAQQAYKNRLNAEVNRFRATYALLASELGEKAESARRLASTVKNAEQKRTLVLEASHAERRRNIMLEAANAVTKSLENLPGFSAQHAPPSAQQVTAGATGSFRSPEFLSRFTHFFPSDVRTAASSIQNNGFGGFDAVADCEACLRRDLVTVRKACCEIPEKLSGVSGDPMASNLVRRASQFAQVGFGSAPLAPTTGSNAQGVIGASTSIVPVVVGLGLVGAAYFFFTRS